MVCTTALAKYKCPKCRIPYCSLACYTKHGTTCTEAFYKDQVEEELLMRSGGTSMTGPEIAREKNKMLDILKRTSENEALDEKHLAHELEQLTLLAEKDEDEVSLDDLSPEQRRDFLRAVADGSIMKANIIHLWTPWWVTCQDIDPKRHNHAYKPLVSAVSAVSAISTRSSSAAPVASVAATNGSTSTSNRTPLQPPLRIFCLGDSLTAGYTNRGQLYHPYSRQLEQSLLQHFQQRLVEVDHCGMCGWTTKKLFKVKDKGSQGRDFCGMDGGPGICYRLKTRLDENEEYHHVVLLTGTNDVSDVVQRKSQEFRMDDKKKDDVVNKGGSNAPTSALTRYAKEIVHDIMQLHQACRKACPNVITHGMTLPRPSAAAAASSLLLESLRLATNALLRKVSRYHRKQTVV